MKESIHIHDFGPLRCVRIDDIKPLTVLIGDSASGKSTLMKVIAMMRYLCKRANINAYNATSRIKIDSIEEDESIIEEDESMIEENDSIDEYFYKIWKGALLMISPDTFIEYTVYTPNGGEYSYVFFGPDYHFLTPRDNFNHSIRNEDLVFFKESFISETRSLIPEWYTRGAAARGGGMGYYFNETFDDFFRAMEQVNEQPLDYLGMKMYVQQVFMQKELLVKYENPKDEDLELVNVVLRDASSGIQTSAPLMTIVRYFAHEFSFTDAFQRSVLSSLLNKGRLTQFRPKVDLQNIPKHIHIYIEEPELSLDPKTQCLFINDLIREAFYRGDNKRPADGRQLGLMFATHSPYILNHLNVLLKASYYEKARERYPYINPDEIAVYRLHNGEVHSLVEDDEETGERIIDTYKFSETMEWILDKYESVD